MPECAVSVHHHLTRLQDVGTIRSSQMTGMDYEIGYLGHQVSLTASYSFLLIFF